MEEKEYQVVIYLLTNVGMITEVRQTKDIDSIKELIKELEFFKGKEVSLDFFGDFGDYNGEDKDKIQERLEELEFNELDNCSLKILDWKTFEVKVIDLGE